MTHIPGHHGRGIEASGPLVDPGKGYQERDATKPTMSREEAYLACRDFASDQRVVIEWRADEIEAGLVHLTPAMAEAMERRKHTV